MPSSTSSLAPSTRAAAYRTHRQGARGLSGGHPLHDRRRDSAADLLGGVRDLTIGERLFSGLWTLPRTHEMVCRLQTLRCEQNPALVRVRVRPELYQLYLPGPPCLARRLAGHPKARRIEPNSRAAVGRPISVVHQCCKAASDIATSFAPIPLASLSLPTAPALAAPAYSTHPSTPLATRQPPPLRRPRSRPRRRHRPADLLPCSRQRGLSATL